MIRGAVLRIFCVLLLGGLTDLQQTEHLASYQLTVPRPIGGGLKRDVDGTPPSQVAFMVGVDGEELVLRLDRNTKLLSDNFTVFTYGEDGLLRSSSPPVQKHCHYQGSIQGEEGSSVAMSVCDGLRGVIHRSNISYGIEPLDSAPHQHLLYRLQDVTSQPQGCGTPHSTTTKSPPYTTQKIQHTVHSRVKRATLHKTYYVELLLVVDNDRFSFMNRNETAVREQMIHLANYIDTIYQQLNVRVVLVALEVWTHQNLISTEGSAGDVLSRFTQWREKELSQRRRHDSAQLILKKSFRGTAGMAFVSSICSRSHGGGINTFVNNNVQSLASIVAHELGHNLGMTHDDNRSCSCPDPLCIMHSGATGSSSFSSCSSEDLEKLLLDGGRCLLNMPQPEEAYSAPYCGNRLLDSGEECDCGSQTECELDPCCEFLTCKLKLGAQCGYGECCSKCQFLPAGSVCRSSSDECDLPEFCNGSSPLCQADVFIQDGAPCRSQQSLCYNGRCQNRDRQCQDIFGKKAKAAPEICFKEVNSKGDRFGNCGYHSYGYKKCESRNTLCGKLQCLNVREGTVFGVKPAIIVTPIGANECYGVDFGLGSDVPDPGMVNEGTKCGDNKVCINSECRSADVLNYDCDTHKCHGRGVCNNNRNCHCEDGWAPPLCELPGYGGSVDSGPTWNDKDTSLRDGLLVFFFLLLPLGALCVFLFLRREQVLLRLGLNRRKRTHRYQADSNISANANRGQQGQGNNSDVIRDVHRAQLLPSPQVVETNRTTPSYARRPPPPLKPKPAVTQPLVPQRPAPPPPV